MVDVFEAYMEAKEKEQGTVLVTIVDSDLDECHLVGERMLVSEEKVLSPIPSELNKEFLLQASKELFETKKPKIIHYQVEDKTHYLLAESFAPHDIVVESFEEQRKQDLPFSIISFYHRSEGEEPNLRSIISLRKGVFTFSGKPLVIDNSQLNIYKQELCF